MGGEARRCCCGRACECAAAEGGDFSYASAVQEGEGDEDHGCDEGRGLPSQDPHGPRGLSSVWHPPAQPPHQGGQGVDARSPSSRSLLLYVAAFALDTSVCVVIMVARRVCGSVKCSGCGFHVWLQRRA